MAAHQDGEERVDGDAAADADLATAQGRLHALTERSKAEVTRRKGQAETGLAHWRDRNVVVDIAVRVRERDVSAAGSVVGSAVAFRLFLFFVPLLLFVVGFAGFLRDLVDAKTVNSTTGLSGTLADQIRTALSQSGSTRWVATALGLFGMLTAGRTLTRVLVAASSLAWRVPVRFKASVKAMSAVIGIMVALVLLATLVNRASDRGVAVAGASLLTASIVYGVAWLGLSLALPRGTSDPGAMLPGAVVFAAAMTGLQALTQLYLPGKISHASHLYGAIGVTIATLGWFFLIGRAIVLAMVLNAVVFERVGSISGVFFSLPLLRVLPRRSPRLRRFFDLDHERGGSPAPADADGAEPEPAAPPPSPQP